jgi:hypothetical protein
MAFKDLFIQSGPTPPKQPVVAQEVAPNAESIMPSQPVVGKAPVDKDIEAKIWDMIVAKNLPGPDYIEFKNTAAGLVEITSDESMQLKGAFNVLKRTYPAFTKEIILSSIDTYIGIVNEEKEKGKKECEELRKTKVGDKVTSIDNMKNAAQEILKQIEELKKQYEDVNAEIHKLEIEVTEATNEIDSKEKIFDSSVQAVINTLNADKVKVSNLNV